MLVGTHVQELVIPLLPDFDSVPTALKLAAKRTDVFTFRIENKNRRVIFQVGSYRLRGKRIFRMAPIHHHFELGGWPEQKVVIRFWIVAIIFALASLSTLKLR